MYQPWFKGDDRLFSDLEVDHRNELVHLYNVKRRYKAMVLEQGRENVELQLTISEMHARRRRFIRHGGYVDADDFHMLDQFSTRSNTTSSRIDDTMLY